MKSIVYFLPFSLILPAVMIFQNTENVHSKSNEKEFSGPQLVSPGLYYDAGGAECRMSWTSHSEALCYEIWIAENQEFQNCGQIVSYDTVYTYTSKAQSKVVHYWKVRTWLKDKAHSNWSVTGIFYAGNYNIPVDIISPHGCNRDCGNCSNPCGRRSPRN
jgi:hypothetical protein